MIHSGSGTVSIVQGVEDESTLTSQMKPTRRTLVSEDQKGVTVESIQEAQELIRQGKLAEAERIARSVGVVVGVIHSASEVEDKSRKLERTRRENPLGANTATRFDPAQQIDALERIGRLGTTSFSASIEGGAPGLETSLKERREGYKKAYYLDDLDVRKTHHQKKSERLEELARKYNGEDHAAAMGMSADALKLAGAYQNENAANIANMLANNGGHEVAQKLRRASELERGAAGDAERAIGSFTTADAHERDMAGSSARINENLKLALDQGQSDGRIVFSESEKGQMKKAYEEGWLLEWLRMSRPGLITEGSRAVESALGNQDTAFAWSVRSDVEGTRAGNAELGTFQARHFLDRAAVTARHWTELNMGALDRGIMSQRAKDARVYIDVMGAKALSTTLQIAKMWATDPEKTRSFLSGGDGFVVAPQVDFTLRIGTQPLAHTEGQRVYRDRDSILDDVKAATSAIIQIEYGGLAGKAPPDVFQKAKGRKGAKRPKAEASEEAFASLLGFMQRADMASMGFVKADEAVIMRAEDASHAQKTQDISIRKDGYVPAELSGRTCRRSRMQRIWQIPCTSSFSAGRSGWRISDSRSPQG